MQIRRCTAPSDTLEPAPLTSLPLEIMNGAAPQAYWSGDDGYYLRTDSPSGEQWYRADVCTSPAHSTSAEALESLVRTMSTVLPFSAGRVAFPIGTAGRTVFRVWRSNASAKGRTKILGVRAARSRRQPA